jgi:hypothetical protein
VAPLDEFLDRIEGRLALKVDTQGAEPFVVAGGKGVFAKAGLVLLSRKITKPTGSFAWSDASAIRYE